MYAYCRCCWLQMAMKHNLLGSLRIDVVIQAFSSSSYRIHKKKLCNKLCSRIGNVLTSQVQSILVVAVVVKAVPTTIKHNLVCYCECLMCTVVDVCFLLLYTSPKATFIVNIIEYKSEIVLDLLTYYIYRWLISIREIQRHNLFELDVTYSTVHIYQNTMVGIFTVYSIRRYSYCRF